MYSSEQCSWGYPPDPTSTLSAAAMPYFPGAAPDDGYNSAPTSYDDGAWPPALPAKGEARPQAAGGYQPQGAPVLELAVALEGSTTPASKPGAAGEAPWSSSPWPQEDMSARARGFTQPSWFKTGGGSGPQAPAKIRRGRAPGEQDETPTKAARAAAQLKQLLDFYFEPFNLQHNRYLLDLIARRVGPPAKKGPWLAETLCGFHFSFDDLTGLGRIASALSKLKLSQCEALGAFKHLRWSADGRLQLQAPPEVRSFVPAETASAEAVNAAVRYLAAVREQRGKAPPGILSCLSYALGAPLADQSPHGQQRHAQLKRQLLLHHTDLMCLQGFDPEENGALLTPALVEEGYHYAWAKCASGEVNSIFWDRNRMELIRREEFHAAIAVDLRCFEDPDAVFRVICMRPQVPTSFDTGLSHLFSGREPEGPIIVCADLTPLGGAEGSSVVEELVGLHSLPHEVLGDELLVPLSEPTPDGDVAPVRAAASGLNRLHSPDAMLFKGVVPILALSGHTERYMTTMAAEDAVQQFPAFRVPIVAAFNWHTAQTEASQAVLQPTP